MADIETLPQGGDGQAAPTTEQPFRIHDEQSAADAILQAGLLDDDGDLDAPDSGDEPDAGAQETAPTGEEEGQSEPPATAAIEPPNSWTAEEKALFAKLPPEAQTAISRRESERERLINERTQEIAEQRKAHEAATQAVNTERAQYAQNLQILAALAAPELAQFQNIDWVKLATENPAEAVRLRAVKDGLDQRFGAIQQQLAAVQQKANEERQQRIGQVIAEQKKLLIDKLPEFGDAAKGPKLVKDLQEHLGHYGFSPEEIGQAVDHRLVLLARDAMLYRQGEQARKAAAGKVTPPTPPRVQQPGTPPAAPQDARSRNVRDAIGRFNKTGSTSDAAKLLEFIL